LDIPSCRPEELLPQVRRFSPTIIHFSGHGSQAGLYIEDDNGNSVLIEPQRLAGVLALACQQGLKGVVMNACYSESQAAIIADTVGHVVAMEGVLSDRGAIAFSREFYAALGDGSEFDVAFEWALQGSGLTASVGPLSPRLIKSKPAYDVYPSWNRCNLLTYNSPNIMPSRIARLKSKALPSPPDSEGDDDKRASHGSRAHHSVPALVAPSSFSDTEEEDDLQRAIALSLKDISTVDQQEFAPGGSAETCNVIL
jgi:hypothetical protein